MGCLLLIQSILLLMHNSAYAVVGFGEACLPKIFLLAGWLAALPPTSRPKNSFWRGPVPSGCPSKPPAEKGPRKILGISIMQDHSRPPARFPLLRTWS